MKTAINEIFSSIQGEGQFAGYKQLFIRFCNCNLKCIYCDTDFLAGEPYTPQELYKKITAEYNIHTFHSISLTGGEPLLSAEFLMEFLPLVKQKTKIYLETNATMPDKLIMLKNYIDIISADIKLKSAAGFDTIHLHRKFFEHCRGIETFAKIVFDENITETEIQDCCNLGREFNIALVLQPKTQGVNSVSNLDEISTYNTSSQGVNADANLDGVCETTGFKRVNKMCVSPEFCCKLLDRFTCRYKNVRLIPQVHKFLEVK